MRQAQQVWLLDGDGNEVAELRIDGVDEGWWTGIVVRNQLSAEVQQALAWYDEVIRDQMLSYLDVALAGVQRFTLRARFPDGPARPVYSLHVGEANEVSFRVSSVAPPPDLATVESVPHLEMVAARSIAPASDSLSP